MTRFEAGKEYKTRDGRRARIYATDGGGAYPLHGAVFGDAIDEWGQERWTLAGMVCVWRTSVLVPDSLDLMPPAREVWIVDSITFYNEDRAREHALKRAKEVIHFREVTEE